MARFLEKEITQLAKGVAREEIPAAERRTASTRRRNTSARRRTASTSKGATRSRARSAK